MVVEWHLISLLSPWRRIPSAAATSFHHVGMPRTLTVVNYCFVWTKLSLLNRFNSQRFSFSFSWDSAISFWLYGKCILCVGRARVWCPWTVEKRRGKDDKGASTCCHVLLSPLTPQLPAWDRSGRGYYYCPALGPDFDGSERAESPCFSGQIQSVTQYALVIFGTCFF